MQFQQTQDFEKVLLQFSQIPEVFFSEITSGNATLSIIESEENLKPFLSFLYFLSNDFLFSDKDLENHICKQCEDQKVYISSSNNFQPIISLNFEELKGVILTEFNNVKYYAYHTQIKKFEKADDNNIDDVNHFVQIFFEGEQQFKILLEEYPQLTKIKNQKELNYEQLKNLTTVYETHDYSLPDISFHYNADGSQAILCSLFCQKEIIEKAIIQRDDFDSYFYDLQSMNFLLQKEKSMILEDFDAHLQSYDNSSIPLSTFLSIKFEESKKYLNNLGIYQKKNLSQIGTIPNLRLRQDLFELYECIDNDLEFDDLYQDQYCYAYYAQGDNPFLLEGLIVGPEDTPYQGVVYTLTIKVPQDYPNTPPDVSFNEKVLHPNISEKGRICLDILNNKWSPALTIQKVLISIVSLLYEKNLDDVYNHYAKCLYIENPLELKHQIFKQAVFSGCKKVDINYNEVSKLSCEQKRNNMKESEDVNEYDYENQEEVIEDNDCCEDE